jgi:hypothetical protein
MLELARNFFLVKFREKSLFASDKSFSYESNPSLLKKITNMPKITLSP